MDDLISRQQAIDAFGGIIIVNEEQVQRYIEGVIDKIKASPSIDSVKHGRWTIVYSYSTTYKYCCSECGAHHRARYDYCPSCGARMDERKEK